MPHPPVERELRTGFVGRYSLQLPTL